MAKRQNIYCVIIIQHIRTSQNRLHKSRRGCLFRINILCHLNINVSLYEYLFTTFPTPWCRLSSSSSDTHESMDFSVYAYVYHIPACRPHSFYSTNMTVGLVCDATKCRAEVENPVEFLSTWCVFEWSDLPHKNALINILLRFWFAYHFP